MSSYFCLLKCFQSIQTLVDTFKKVISSNISDYCNHLNATADKRSSGNETRSSYFCNVLFIVFSISFLLIFKLQV